MEGNYLTLADFTPQMIIIGIVVLAIQLVICYKIEKSMVSSIPLCVLVFGLFLSSLAPVWNIGSKEFQATMSTLMYYFCITSIGDIVAWLIYYIHSLIAHRY